MKILGIRQLDFTDQQSGRRIEGYQVFYMSEPIDSKLGSGFTTDKAFISTDALVRSDEFKVGDDVEIFFQKGKNSIYRILKA